MALDYRVPHAFVADTLNYAAEAESIGVFLAEAGGKNGKLLEVWAYLEGWG